MVATVLIFPVDGSVRSFKPLPVMAFMIIMLLALLASNAVGAANVSDTQNLLTDLFEDNNVNIRPAVDQLSTVNVSLKMYLKSIMEFDEVYPSPQAS